MMNLLCILFVKCKSNANIKCDQQRDKVNEILIEICQNVFNEKIIKFQFIKSFNHNQFKLRRKCSFNISSTSNLSVYNWI